jgi:anti-sigma factor RsiW
MNYNAQLKLQAWLDGELSEAEARQVAEQVARDRDGAALAEELRNTRRAIVGFESEIRLPESREFYWSKIAREIQRLEAAPPKPASPDSAFALFRRWLVPASAVALVVFAGLLLIRPPAPSSGPANAEPETALVADADAFTYRDYAAGTTLVWLSYPADNEVADGGGLGTLN